MSYEEPLLRGLKALILAEVSPAPPGFLGDLPTSPDRAFALTAYASVDEVNIARSTVRVQVMCRGVRNDSLDPGRLGDSIFDVLHAREGIVIDDLHVALCTRISAVPLGIDSLNRSTRSDNYELIVDAPLTARRPA